MCSYEWRSCRFGVRHGETSRSETRTWLEDNDCNHKECYNDWGYDYCYVMSWWRVSTNTGHISIYTTSHGTTSNTITDGSDTSSCMQSYKLLWPLIISRNCCFLFDNIILCVGGKWNRFGSNIGQSDAWLLLLDEHGTHWVALYGTYLSYSVLKLKRWGAFRWFVAIFLSGWLGMKELMQLVEVDEKSKEAKEKKSKRDKEGEKSL